MFSIFINLNYICIIYNLFFSRSSYYSYYLNSACDILTEATLIDFPYYKFQGEYKLGHPGQEINVWDTTQQCIDAPGTAACNYKVGGVYWKAFHGTTASAYCTTDEGKC